MLIVNHAADQFVFSSHLFVHGKAKTFNPKSQVLLEISAGNYRYAGFNNHMHFLLLVIRDPRTKPEYDRQLFPSLVLRK